MLQHIGHERCPVAMKEGRDVWWHDAPRAQPSDTALALAKKPPRSTPSTRSSSSTRRARPGSRRACSTRRAGYLAGAHVTTKYVFDLQRERPLLVHRRRRLGHRPQLHRLRPALRTARPCLMYEGAPNFPDWGRFWQHHREARRHDPLHGADGDPRLHAPGRRVARQKRDLSSLRLLGTVGEPINPEAWIWYHTRRSAAAAARSSTRGGRPRPARS